MTPFAKLLFLALIGLLVVVLLVRIALRWYRDRQALAEMERSPYRPNPVRKTVDAEPLAASEPIIPPAASAVTPPKQAPVPVERPDYSGILSTDPVPPRPAYVATESAAAASAVALAEAPSTYRGPDLYRSTARLDELQKFDSEDMPFADTSDYNYGLATPMLAAMLPESAEKKSAMKRMLKSAGYYTPHAWHNLAATRYIGLVLPILLFGALLILVPQRFELPIVGCLIAFPILGYALPGLLVQNQAQSRIKEIEQGLPDMLDMLNMCVSQGMTLPTALQRVGLELRGVYPDLAQELAIVSDQARIAGLPSALQSFSDRVDSPDVQSFAALLMQTEKMGTSVSGALSDYSENMRESLRQRADMKGNSATFKLLFPTVFCLMPAVFLFLLGPAIVQLHDFYTGGGTQVLRTEANSVLRNQERGSRPAAF
ncbi:MAG: type II secretion system F family protein [Planctomycetaceae bacterium]